MSHFLYIRQTTRDQYIKCVCFGFLRSCVCVLIVEGHLLVITKIVCVCFYVINLCESFDPKKGVAVSRILLFNEIITTTCVCYRLKSTTKKKDKKREFLFSHTQFVH